MEDNKIDIIAKINILTPRMSKSHKKIAAYIMEHYDQAVFMTAAKLGKEAGVSESTVVRFAYALDYEGYPEFQKDLAVWVQDRLGSLQKINLEYGNRSQSEVINAVLTADIEKISSTMGSIDPEAFETAVNIILSSKTVYIVGLRSCSPLAEFLSFYLNMVRENVVLLKTTSVTEMFEQMIRIDQSDCIVGISFPRYSMRTLKCLEFANDRSAKIITITDTALSPMNMYSSCNLFARSDMVSIVDSLVAPLSVINALVVAICLKRPEQVKINLRTLENVWNNYQVYLNDEINFIKDEPILNYSLMQGTTGTKKL